MPAEVLAPSSPGRLLAEPLGGGLLGSELEKWSRVET